MESTHSSLTVREIRHLLSLTRDPFPFVGNHILFGGNLRHKEKMGQSFVCALALDGERREKSNFYLEVLAFRCLCKDVDTWARNLSFCHSQWTARVWFSSLNIHVGWVVWLRVYRTPTWLWSSVCRTHRLFQSSSDSNTRLFLGTWIAHLISEAWDTVPAPLK